MIAQTFARVAQQDVASVVIARGTTIAARGSMKLGMISALGLSAIVLAQTGCSSDSSSEDPSASEGEALVETSDDDGALDAPITAADDDLGPDPEAMVTDSEIEALAARPDEVQEAEAAGELDDLAAESAVPPPAKVRCKKRITVTFAVYNYLAKDLGSNGCWVAEDTNSDPDFRDCHVDGSVRHKNGTRWFYDDTNPYNNLSREKSLIHSCASGEKRGYEYMAFRAGAWRLVAQRHTSAYFAELYTDDQHIDNLWYQPSVYRHNRSLRSHKRVAPMLNFAPYPDGRYSQGQIGREILKVCKTIRNHGFLGLYEWHYSLPHDSPRLRGMTHALNACTRRK